MMEFKSTSRPSPIAGTWYIGDPPALRIQIDEFINDAKVSKEDVPGEIIGLVAPHAGHRYSGKTAGYAYKTIKGKKIDLVVILSPFHQYMSADLITTDYQTFQTPLGKIPVDIQALNDCERILKNDGIFISQVSDDTEHSLEIQLPFLQQCVGSEFKLFPLMIRSVDKKILEYVADALFEVIKDRSFVVIASTDLSHFYPLDIAEQMDGEMLRRIKSMDADSVLLAEQNGAASACGASAVAVMLRITKKAGAKKTYILNYSTSADSTGDKTSVVGYGAAAVVL
jgi:MEMO1 family protein